MECKCRFLDEYANYKKRKYGEWAKEGWFSETQYEEKKTQIDNVLRNMYRGMITLDEAMRAISEI